MAVSSSIDGVPLLDLNAQYETLKEEVSQSINRVLESQYFIMGPEVKSFEQDIAEYCDSEYAIGCASGSDALLLSLMALDIGPDDAVITTPFTFFATAGAVARLGATPVFLDIDPLSYNIDPEQVKLFLMGRHPLNQKLGINPSQVKAIIPVHLYGQVADMDPLLEVAGNHGIAVIEDAAQAIGSEYKAQKAGSIGDFGCFSFFPSKNLGGYGDGGMIITDNAEMAEKLGILRLHGARPKYHHSMVGINSRLDALQAAILKVKLKYLDNWSEARREKALNYNRLFTEAGLSGEAQEAICTDACISKGESGCNMIAKNKVICPVELTGHPVKDGRHIYHQYVIRVGKREKIQEVLDENNIGYSIYYPVSLHEQECFNYLGYEPSDCAVATCASKTTLALPIYPELTNEQQAFVVDTIKHTLNK